VFEERAVRREFFSGLQRSFWQSHCSPAAASLMRKVSIPALCAALAMSIACSEGTTEPTTATLQALWATPSTLALVTGDSSQLRTVATHLDGTTEVLTSSVTYQSSSTSVAVVDDSGIVTAVAAGTTNVTVASGGLTATVTVTVSDTGSSSRTFTGTVAGPESTSGTFTVAVNANTRVTGSLHLPRILVGLLGRFDTPTNIVNVSGGGYTLIGAIAGGQWTGTFVDAAGRSGGFSAIESTHTAVTVFCGSYTGEEDPGGVWNLQRSADGTATGEAMATDGSSGPFLLSGTATGGAFTLAGSGASASGSISGSSLTGSLSRSSAAPVTLSATTGACP
jgi:hypothetical protein